MPWIKRNLYFLVASVVALVLLLLSGAYLFSKYELNKTNLEELTKASTEWKRILDLAVGPGNDKINNIETAREQQAKVLAKVRDVQKQFQPILPIPDPAEVAAKKEELAPAMRSALRRTIDQLQRDAANNSVTLPAQNYAFSFKVQRDQYNFPPGSLEPLAVQLGEVKAICDVLFRAKINSLDTLQRERVSVDDLNGPPAEYLDPSHTSVTNELAILTPYVITLRGFSAELASVLAGFGNDPHGFIVKAVNVEPATGAGLTMSDPTGAISGMGGMNPYERAYAPAGYPGGYGVPPGTPTAAGATPPRPGVLPTVLDEKQLRITLVVVVVKILPKK